MRCFLVGLLLLLSAAPAAANPMAMFAAMGPSSVTVTNDFDDFTLQGWTAGTGLVLNTTEPPDHLSDPNVVMTAESFSGSATLTKTITMSDGDWTVHVRKIGSGSGGCSFQVDSETPVGCMPTAFNEWQAFSQTVTGGSRSLTITVNTASTMSILLDDITYKAPAP